MQKRTNILFIINPISGGTRKSRVPALIDRYLDKARYNPNFRFTEHRGHAAELADEALRKQFDILVAVGGDGTINEVAGKVMEHGKTLGIIALGSGNGLARFLQIPLDPKKAIQSLNTGRELAVDTAVFNDRVFFNMAGMGFDAHLSSVFAEEKGRGLLGYLRQGLAEIGTYGSKHYQISVDGKAYVREAFAISIANSSQYGNNVFIAPQASVTDGLLEVCIIKPFPLRRLPEIAWVMLRRKAHTSDLIEIISGKEILISRDTEAAVHIDGEPLYMGKDLHISVRPASLNIIVPNHTL
ncbi:diacylglycerol kinase [Pedobacter yulinensis]|uniref:Diacylglycerol kinase n=1 Tax=Pedobacter yulinensis TaxID=2126353 RepID=A0A2T3HQZ6_9SPHI|nr:diacylglycerol kinase family protein [Pedobacter yulinensis]PST84823.1 diacylglycerol kinase [Pedobacter yulinensis]